MFSNSVLSVSERVIVVITAIVLHLLLAIILFYTQIWERPIPAPKPAGITLVSFGTVSDPSPTPSASQPELFPPITKEVEEIKEEVNSQNIETQEVEDTQVASSEIQTVEKESEVSISKPIKKQEKSEKKVEKLKDVEKPKISKKQEQEVEKQPIKTEKTEKTKNTEDHVSQEDTKSNSSQETEDTSSKEKQGNSNNPDDTDKVGVNGGAEVSIPGWRWVNRPKLEDTINDQGKIVFNVTIARSGEVIEATLSSKTQGIGPRTLSMYQRALLETKFESTLSEVTTEEITTGTVTFTIRVGQ